MSSRALIAWSAALLVAALLVAGCGGSSDTPASQAVKAEPPLYHQSLYDFETFGGAVQVESDKRIGDTLESVWANPNNAKETIAVTASTESPNSPREEAELSREQIKLLPGYSEHSFKAVRLRGRPATQWTYEVAGIGRSEYFFEACGVHYAFIANIYVKPFGIPIELRYRRIAKLIVPVCALS
ncbi:MAG TPA: hypothetical protein VG816_07215 [Solirubrobacterales bacterium]|nr:hypothetical protein [Solirubrobacterales bacterium]